ncbi:MAG: flippase-like domain-containing protein [Bacteroidales bacterium]|nr:flippase-like domain-containing protein [Bacteroidales bacterium]MBN2818206.1 flippase-like domain-containing protein [Bacteroidales bacterium]
MKNKQVKRTSKWFLLIRLTGIVLFVVLIFRMDFKEIWSHLKEVKVSFFLLALFFQFVLLLIKSYRWHLLKNNYQKPNTLLFDFSIFLESYAIGVVTPGRLGELVKSGYEETKKSKWYSALKILAERGFDLGIFLLIAGYAVLAFSILPLERWVAWLIILSAIILILISTVLITRNKLKSKIREIIIKRTKLVRDDTDIDFNLNRYSLLGVIILSISGNIATFISCYLLALGIDMQSSFWFISGGVSVAGLLNLLPITIMGIGTREFSFLYIFSSFNQSIVLGFSFLMFLVLQIGGGLLALLMGQFFNLWRRKNSV